MQMIDVLKRLAELDAQNPNIVKETSTESSGWKQTSLSMADAVAKYGKENVKIDGKNRLGEPIVAVKVPMASKEGVAEGSGPKEKQHDKYVDRSSPESKAKVQAAKDKMASDKAAEPGKKLADKIAKKDVAESLEECGMMGGMSQPHSPASINMTAATGEELSSMLKDIMTLAGRSMQEPMGGEEPMGGADGVAVVDVEPSPEVGADDTSVMRSMIDKLNPSDDDSDSDSDAGEQPSDDDEEKVDEYDNSPDPTTAGYDAAVPSGNDLHKEKSQYPAAQRGDNPMAATFEGLMAEYKKFISEN